MYKQSPFKGISAGYLMFISTEAQDQDGALYARGINCWVMDRDAEISSDKRFE
jgi:hypothetical protein